jgi:TonB dependent receptor/Carboxypeptidase regulatory-like domain/TonB-dependent Receptor Plug Domain
MKKLLFALAALALAASAAAQEQRASVEGTIRDSSGAVMPGVTVDARSPNMAGMQSTTTDAAGTYRFPALPPGRYELTATLQGFQPAKASDVRLELGQIIKIDLTLAAGTVTETVQVKAESPLIDVKQNAAGGNVQSETIDRIPKGRDFAGLLTSIPAVTNESRNRGIQIDGASGADNRFLIDGVDTTNLLNGTSGKGLAPDFVKEVQVKASGYAAEYRASLGGVISAITKSGSNDYHGSAGIYFTSDNLQGDVRQTLRLNPSNQNVSEYVTTPPDDYVSPEPIFDLGGPVLRDRLWFYAGYDPSWTKRTRTVTFNNNTSGTFSQKPISNIVNYNVTGQISKSLRGRFAVSNQRDKGGYALPNSGPGGRSTSNPALFPSVIRRDSSNDSYSGVLDWVVDNRTYVNITTTRFKTGQHDVGQFSTALRHTFQASNFQFPEIPAALQQQSGFADNPSSTQFVRGNLSRFNFNADVTRYGTWRGQHTLKGGLQVERIRDDTLSGEQAATVQLFWDSSYATNDGRRVRGTYGYYDVVRFFTQGDIHSNNVGLFVQDAWTLNSKLTLNLGIRAENEDVPSYRAENPGVHFNFADKIAPRAGFAYDLHGNSQWKLYGSWGVFYDLMKLTIGRVMFGGDKWVNYYYTMDTFDWPSISCGDGAPGSGCPGTFIQAFDFRPVANNPNHQLVDPDLKPARSQEFTLGIDHELSRTMSLGARYAHKWVDYAIEAVCNFTPSGEEDCGVNNPGFGSELGVYPLGRNNPAQPPAKRDYYGIEVRLRKRLANRWSADVSYLYSYLRGNWSGIASSDEAVGSLQPNSGRAFNLLYYSFDAQGNPTFGRLGTDRPHQFKLQGTYDLPWGTLVGVNAIVESGIPKSTIASQKNINFFPFGRGNLGRTPNYSQVDLLLQQEFRLLGRTRATIGVNAINVFDQKTVTGFSTTPYRDQFNLSDAAFFGGFDPAAVATAQNFRRDARFGLASGYQDARVIRVQAKFSF